MERGGIYIHFPFCRKKCAYCDFFSGGVKGMDLKVFTDCLVNELQERREELQFLPSTLYIGGGTPSLIPKEIFPDFIRQINILANREEEWDEFTLEVNPEDVTVEMCEIWRSSGVNRISMGVQSLNDKELRLINRNHDRETALKALETLKSFFSNVTIDLMFGLPEQNLESWKETVEEILTYKPQHISCYNLMFEEKTPITVLRDNGKLTFPDDVKIIKMWRYLSDRLFKEGYRQYEISNYALPGFESIHNYRYWTGNPYLGLGPGAHSYDGVNIRKANFTNIRGYISGFRDSQNQRGDKFYSEESLNMRELAEENIMLSLRTAEGLDMEKFKSKFGSLLYRIIERDSIEMIKKGVLEIIDNRLRLTKEGIMISDQVILSVCKRI